MNEKLILLEDIQGLGKAGETVSVASGHARNYLLPKKLALKASKGALRQFESRKEKIETKRAAELKKMQDIAAQVAKLEITIPVNVGEDDKLFGSVTTHNIAEEITKLGTEVDHTKIILDDNIKELGIYDIKVKIHAEVIAKSRVWIVRA